MFMDVYTQTYMNIRSNVDTYMHVTFIHSYIHTKGTPNQWAVKPMSRRTNGPSDQWVIGPVGPMSTSDQCAVGPTDCWTTESSDQWVHKIWSFLRTGHRTNGLSDQRTSDLRVVGSTDRRTKDKPRRTWLRFDAYIMTIIYWLFCMTITDYSAWQLLIILHEYYWLFTWILLIIQWPLLISIHG